MVLTSLDLVFLSETETSKNTSESETRPSKVVSSLVYTPRLISSTLILYSRWKTCHVNASSLVQELLYETLVLFNSYIALSHDI